MQHVRMEKYHANENNVSVDRYLALSFSLMHNPLVPLDVVA